MTSRRMDKCRTISAFCLLLGLLTTFCILSTATATNSWWHFESSNLVARMGLWQFCNEETKKCYNLDAVAEVGNTMIDIIRTLSIIAVILAGIGVLTSCVSPFTASIKKVFVIFVLVEIFFAVLGGIFGIAALIVTIYDSKNIFSLDGGKSLHYRFEWSFYAAWISCILNLCFGLLAVLLVLYTCFVPDKPDQPNNSERVFLSDMSPRSDVYTDPAQSHALMTTENVEYMNRLYEERESMHLLPPSQLTRSQSSRSSRTRRTAESDPPEYDALYPIGESRRENRRGSDYVRETGYAVDDEDSPERLYNLRENQNKRVVRSQSMRSRGDFPIQNVKPCNLLAVPQAVPHRGTSGRRSIDRDSNRLEENTGTNISLSINNNGEVIKQATKKRLSEPSSYLSTRTSSEIDQPADLSSPIVIQVEDGGCEEEERVGVAQSERAAMLSAEEKEDMRTPPIVTKISRSYGLSRSTANERSYLAS